MNASELRIGNFVSCGNGKVAKVTGLLTNNSVRLYAKEEVTGWWVTTTTLQPIPLTHKVMESLGFVNAQGAFWHQGFENYDFHSIGLPEWEIIRSTGDHEYDTVENVVSTLHELQNYYFALTGEEFPIDLDKLKQAITNETTSANSNKAQSAERSV